MDAVDIAIVNRLQNGLPVCTSPYLQVSAELGITETELLNRLRVLLESRVLTRFGPMYHAELLGGAVTLAAIKVPEQRFDSITDIINTFPEVAHNYARNHVFNMWFVIATETPERIEQVIHEIEEKTGLTVYNMPKITEYFVELKLDAS